MAYLSSIELDEGRGQRVGVVIKSNGAPTMVAYVWMDRDRRYFISTASLLQDGKDYSRIRCHSWHPITFKTYPHPLTSAFIEFNTR